jgi:hypothetical protein
VTFGLPEALAEPTAPRPRRRALLQPRRTLPRWPLLLILLGALAAGPVGLLVATSFAAALIVLRLRLIVADPEDTDLPVLRWSRRQHAPVLTGFTRTVSSVEWGLVSAFDFDASLRPRLTRAAGIRLASRRNVDLDAQPAQAARLLGLEAWALLDPARPPVSDRGIRGPDRAALARVLDAVERI